MFSLYSSSSTSTSSSSNLATKFSKVADTVVMLNSPSDRLLQYHKFSTPISHFDSTGVSKYHNNVDTEYRSNYRKQGANHYHVSRRRNSSSVAPPKQTPNLPNLPNPPNNVLSTMTASNSVNNLLFAAANGKRNGYSLDRNNNTVKNEKCNYQRREPKIHFDVEYLLPHSSYQQQLSLSHSTSSTSPGKSSSSTSFLLSESATLYKASNSTDKNQLNEKIMKHTDCITPLSSRSAFYRLYEIGRMIGQGNFSDVYVVFSENNGLKYAVKEINKSRMFGKLYFVENEISILKQCSHRNICKMIDAFECQNFYFLVFEYAQKGDLFETIKRMGRLNERYTAQITYQVSNALYYLHTQKIVHRDVKPENILLGTNLCAKLTDFGLACIVGGPLYRVCGTPTYVAPEILSQEGYGLEVDIWSLGILMYVMLMGFAPFRCSDRAQLFRMIVKAKVSFDTPTWYKISSKAKQLILKMLTPKVMSRFKAIEVINNDWILMYNENIRHA